MSKKSTRPKPSRKSKTLYLMYFVDSNKTKRLSVKVWAIKALALLGLGSGAALAASLCLNYYFTQELMNNNTKITELKATVLAQAIHYDDILSPDYINSMEGKPKLAPEVLQLAEKLQNKDYELKPHLPNYRDTASLEGDASVENLEEGTEVPAQPPAQTVQAAPASVVAEEPKPEGIQLALMAETNPEIAIEKIRFNATQVDAQGQKVEATRVRFTLVNSQKNKRVSGWICAQGISQEGVLQHYPHLVSVDPNTQAPRPESCKRGQKASFRNLRHVDFKIALPIEKLKSVNVIFLDANSEDMSYYSHGIIGQQAQ